MEDYFSLRSNNTAKAPTERLARGERDLGPTIIATQVAQEEVDASADVFFGAAIRGGSTGGPTQGSRGGSA